MQNQQLDLAYNFVQYTNRNIKSIISIALIGLVGCVQNHNSDQTNSILDNSKLDSAQRQTEDAVFSLPSGINIINFPDFQVKINDMWIHETNKNAGEFELENDNLRLETEGKFPLIIAKKDTLYLTTFDGYSKTSAMEIFPKTKTDSFIIYIAYKHNLNEVNVKASKNTGEVSTADYDRWLKTSFKWNGQTPWMQANVVAKNKFSNFYRDTIGFLTREMKVKFQLKDTLVSVPQIIDGRQEPFKITLVRGDKLIGYNITDAIIKIVRLTKNKIADIKYVMFSLDTEY